MVRFAVTGRYFTYFYCDVNQSTLYMTHLLIHCLYFAGFEVYLEQITGHRHFINFRKDEALNILFNCLK